MNRESNQEKNVIYIKKSYGRATKLRLLKQDLSDAIARAGGFSKSALLFVLLVIWHVVRVFICAVLVLFEPIARLILVSVAFLGFFVTLIFGFLMDAPHFPKWGMLLFSAGSLILYWIYLGIMSLFMKLPHGRDYY